MSSNVKEIRRKEEERERLVWRYEGREGRITYQKVNTSGFVEVVQIGRINLSKKII